MFDILRKFSLLKIAALMLITVVATASDMERKPLGGIDFFGCKGLDVPAIRASLLLMNLTKTRNPAVLERLRSEALDPLLEMAQWRNVGHAAPALAILGRIAGIEENTLNKLIENKPTRKRLSRS